MDLKQMREMEEYKEQLQKLESEEALLVKQLEEIKIKKSELRRKIYELSDDKYQQDMLTLVYEQRKRKK